MLPITALEGRRITVGQGAQLSGDELFTFNRAALTRDAKRQLKVLAASLQGNKAIRCEGYADYGGDRSNEIQLSKARAKSVCATLIRDGVAVKATTLGYGPQRPAVVGGSSKARQGNRRVVILVTRR